MLINFGWAKNEKSYEKYRALPPGLQKKYEKGKELPPGWQKKLRKGDVLDETIYSHGEFIEEDESDGAIVIQVDDRIIRLYENTREIIEIINE